MTANAAVVCLHGRGVCPVCRHDDRSRRLSKAHRTQVIAALVAIRRRIEEADYQLEWETPEGDDIALSELGKISDQITATFRTLGRRPPS